VLLQASYRGSKERQLLRTFEKPPCRVVFSFTGHEITLTPKGSQEDPSFSFISHKKNNIFFICHTHSKNNYSSYLTLFFIYTRKILTAAKIKIVSKEHKNQ
jgi:hypothetical protein